MASKARQFVGVARTTKSPVVVQERCLADIVDLNGAWLVVVRQDRARGIEREHYVACIQVIDDVLSDRRGKKSFCSCRNSHLETY